MKRWLVCALIVFASGLSLPTVEAAQYQSSGGQVVHTRMAPVVMHRVLPPFRGRHVYHGRVR